MKSGLLNLNETVQQNHLKNYNMISKLLCIDDDETTLELFRNVAETTFFAKEVITCTSGTEALAYYEKNLEEKSSDTPELIFIDQSLSIMNGSAFLEEFKKTYYNRFNQTKIVILSSFFDTDNVPSNDPIIGYITKPLRIDALKRLMN